MVVNCMNTSLFLHYKSFLFKTLFAASSGNLLPPQNMYCYSCYSSSVTASHVSKSQCLPGVTWHLQLHHVSPSSSTPSAASRWHLSLILTSCLQQEPSPEAEAAAVKAPQATRQQQKEKKNKRKGQRSRCFFVIAVAFLWSRLLHLTHDHRIKMHIQRYHRKVRQRDSCTDTGALKK